MQLAVVEEEFGHGRSAQFDDLDCQNRHNEKASNSAVPSLVAYPHCPLFARKFKADTAQTVHAWLRRYLVI